MADEFQEDAQPVYKTNKGGRPQAFKPAYCDEAIEFLAQGYSITALAGYLGVCRATIYNWKDEHPEFLDAINKGLAKSVLWWESVLRGLAMGQGDGNATAVIFALKNRAAAEWRDRIETEVTGKDGGPIQTADVSENVIAEALTKLSPDERAALRPLLGRLAK